MLCPHCATQVYMCEKNHNKKVYYDNGLKNLSHTGQKLAYQVGEYSCPACDKLVIILEMGLGCCIKGASYDGGELNNLEINRIDFQEILYPKIVTRKTYTDVPENLYTDYKESVAILKLSPKASAALSRRILQTILYEKFNIKKHNLEDEIKEFIKLNEVPSSLAETIDAIRTIGNFAAHPKKCIETQSVIDVEPDEAEWMIEIIEALFDFTFVQKAIAKKRQDNLNNKLQKLKKSADK